jgi:hypothetical protein
MGTWGTGILQNDTTADIWLEFKEHYNKGLSSKDIRVKLEKEYKPLDDEEYYGEIWTGIAHGQWMCGEVEAYTLRKVKEATKKKYLALWSEDEKMSAQRIKVLNDFIDKISIPRPNPLKRKKIVTRHSFFKKGDVIGIKISADKHIAAIVTGHRDFENDGENTIAFTSHLFKEKTTIKDILKSNILYLDIGGPYNYYRGFYKAIFSARNMAKQIDKAFIIGKIKTPEFLSLGIGTPIGDWKKTENLIKEQLEFLKRKKSDRPVNVSVSQFLKRNAKLEKVLIEWDKKIFREKLAP